MKPLHKIKERTKKKNQGNRKTKKGGDMDYNEEKYSNNVTEGTYKYPAKPHKKHNYRIRHDKHQHISSALYFVGDIQEIDVIFLLLSEKLEKYLSRTSFVTNSIILF